MVLDVAVIGLGFGGLGAAVRLRQSGVENLAIFERASDLGGTWRDNTYPGCRCDVASNLYSFSFAPNPQWTNTYSYQPEIQQYLQNVADTYQLRKLIRYNHDVTDISFDETQQLWQLTTTQGVYLARCVVMATGGLAEPRLPEIKGLELFQGPIMHTAKWNEAIDLAGRRVGLVGTGASAIQTVPEIAPLVGSLNVFQRTPSWVLPHLGHPVIERTKRIFSTLPLAQRLVRQWSYWRRELQAKLPGTVWGTGCSSWYLNDSGKNTTIWPDFTFKFRSATRNFDSRDHKISRVKREVTSRD